MNKDCKVSIERDANGRLSVLLTGHKDDIRMLWTMLSINVAKATKTPLPVLCAVCSAAGPAIADLKGAQGVKELLHSMRPHDPLQRNILGA